MFELLFALLFLTATLLPGQRPVAIDGVPADAPFSIAATLQPAGLVIELDLQVGWHVYARDIGGGEPITLRVGDDSALVAEGGLRLPADVDGKLTGKLRIVQAFAIGGGGGEGRTGPGGGEFRAKLSFMVCDPLQCLPPVELALRGTARPLSVLLVTGARDDHAARIETFLRERGFAPRVTTYADVDVASCDAHDLVLADSKLFREDKVARALQVEFPRTKSPIVAVGFLGTQLIEAHGLAMTSGYI